MYLNLVVFCKQEDMKLLITYIIESFYKLLEDVTYVKTFSNLKVRYDQHQDRVKDKISER